MCILGEAWLKLGNIAQAKTLLGFSHAAYHGVGNAAEAAWGLGLRTFFKKDPAQNVYDLDLFSLLNRRG